MTDIDWSRMVTAEDKAAEADARARASVNAEHDRRVKAGRVFTIVGYGDVAPDGSEETKVVLLALDRSARRLKEDGNTGVTLRFTDRNSVDHDLTPDQVTELVDQGTAWVQAMHDARRAIKAMEPMPEDVTDDSLWP